MRRTVMASHTRRHTRTTPTKEHPMNWTSFAIGALIIAVAIILVILL